MTEFRVMANCTVPIEEVEIPDLYVASHDDTFCQHVPVTHLDEIGVDFDSWMNEIWEAQPRIFREFSANFLF